MPKAILAIPACTRFADRRSSVVRYRMGQHWCDVQRCQHLTASYLHPQPLLLGTRTTDTPQPSAQPQKLLFDRSPSEPPPNSYDKCIQLLPRSIHPYDITPSVHLAQVNPHPSKVPARGITSSESWAAKLLHPYEVASSICSARPGFPKPLSSEGVNGAELHSDSST